MRVALTLPVASVRTATPRCRLVRLALNRPFSYQAGQWVTLGLHGERVRRPYSIACAPEEATRRGALDFLVKVDASADGGSPLAGLRRGTLVDVEGPHGRFTIPEERPERRFLFIAGGTGIAPVRAMALHLLLSRRPESIEFIGLLYSARSPREFAYLAEFRRLAREGRIRLLLTASRRAGERWRGARGRLDEARVAPMIEDPATLCFLSGPPGFVRTLASALRRLGVVSSRIRTEEC